MIVRARVILPLCQPPIENGAVVIAGKCIVAVGHWRDLKSHGGEVFDLGDSIVLPGLINAHCHLDYTDMAGMIPPRKSFSSWIKALLALKAAWSYSEYAQSWINGAKMLLRTGTTTVADIEAVPELLPEVWSATPLRIGSLLELTGVKSRRSPKELLNGAAQKIESLHDTKSFAGLSPHALYSTSPELLQRCGKIGRIKNWLLSTHVAESQEEDEMFVHSRGALFNWLKTQRDMSDCGKFSPVEQLARYQLLSDKFLAVHANYISENDAALLSQSQSSVVHCPRSHEYFGHRKFPYERLTKAGVNICLGTDSLASVAKKPHQTIELNMFAEMQSFAKQNPAVSAQTILQMATQNGAAALGMNQHIGRVSPRYRADLIALPFAGKFSEAYEATLHHPDTVSASMVEGQWAVRGDFPGSLLKNT
ncbi:MAG: amidohydrolase family protein [Verrucomicrobiota bacterium]